MGKENQGLGGDGGHQTFWGREEGTERKDKQDRA